MDLTLQSVTPSHHYRPQRSWAKVIFSQACVKNSVHRGGEDVCLSACWDTPREHTPETMHPPGADTTPPQTMHPPGPDPPAPDTPDQAPPQADTTPLEQTHTPLPPDQAPPPEQTPPPPGSRLQHTVNERSVRILLECILVNFCCHRQAQFHISCKFLN